jgi:tetratricopeptide (TPR) repeat protein
MRALPLLVLLSAAPAAAIEPEDTPPPTPTETTTHCTGPTIWDPESEGCVDPREARLPDAVLFAAARELAHAGRLTEAREALDAMQEGDAQRVLTYRAYIAGRAGRLREARALYAQALAADPGDLLARAYLGQALIETGDIAEAEVQLAEIRARGGSGGWAERALLDALARGTGYGG